MARPAGTDVYEIAFEAFGVRVLVSSSGTGDGDRLTALLPPVWRPCDTSSVDKRFAIVGEGSGSYRLLRDGETFTKIPDLGLAVMVLESQVRAYIALHARDRIFVHAGVVGYRDKAIVMPGVSFAGKTTLVAALVHAGATYYSDEYAVLDQEGKVHPYARSLSVRGDDRTRIEQPVESLGGTAGAEPLPIGMVVVTSYRRGAEWNPGQLTPGEGVLALLGNTVAAQTRSAEALRVITRSVSHGAVIVEGDRDEADALAPSLLADVNW